jgi:NAD(P)H-hydrate epimerase
MPIPVISVAQMREWEKATWAGGQSEAEVIRRVGRAIAEHALRLTRANAFILVLAGRGNNGADARNCLDHINERRVDTLDLKDPETDFAKLGALLLLRPALIIDGLFGIGLNRPLDPAWIKFIQCINQAKLPVLAVDVPSGLDADNGEPQGAAIEATVTLTVGAPKTGMLQQSAWPYVGRLEVATDVGLAPCPHTGDFHWTLPQDFSGFPPPRPVAGHKGTFGHAALIAGSAGYHGAAVLAARGAQRARPGLITLLPHEPAYLPAAAQLQSVMVQPWWPDVALPGEFSALLVGPGLASPDVPKELQGATARAWEMLTFPMIVDASALDWLPRGATPKNAVRVITPHPGEAARLLNKTTAQVQANRPQAVRELSRCFGNCWVVLKGHQTLVGRNAGEIFVNSSGNPFLAQGGSGDVLGGFLTGLLAQPALQADPLTTIRYAVWQHGATADLLQITHPNWVVEDLVGALRAGS